MEWLIQDLRHAVRQLTKSPAFVALAVFTVALGIGPTTAVVGIADRFLFRPIPGVTDADRLALVETGKNSPNGGISPISLTYPQRHDVLAAVTAVSGMTTYQPGPDVTVSVGNDLPARLPAVFASADYFGVLGMRPQLGRTFIPDDEPAFGGSSVAVISDHLWLTQFGRASDVIGKTLRVNGEPLSIIGVLPQGFRGVDHAREVDLWLPGMVYPKLMHYAPGAWSRAAASFGFYNFVIRLAPGATFTDAKQQLQTAITRLAEKSPAESQSLEKVDVGMYPGLGVPGRSRETLQTTLRLLLGVGLLVWVVSCANLANLLLARAARRRSETAVRQAIGASTARLLGGQVAEAVVLALLGALASLFLALGITRLFEGLTFTVGPIEPLGLNWRVLGFAVGGAILTGALAAVLPTGLARGVNIARVLQESGRSHGTRVSRVRHMLTVVQLSISATLLVGAFLFVRTLWNLRGIELGFDPSSVMSFNVSLRDVGYTPEQQRAYQLELLRRLQATPGVAAASFSLSGPLVGMTLIERVQVPGTETPLQVASNAVSSGYFATLNIPIVRGENFAGDVDSRNDAVILSEGLATRLFRDHDPVGQTVTLPGQGQMPQRVLNIIGVARDTRWTSLRQDRFTVLYQPLYVNSARGPGGGMLFVRGSPAAAQLARTVREVSRALDPQVALSQEQAYTTFVDRQIASQRMFARVLTLLSIVALALASLGLYGLMVVGVSQRTREFGVRIALGAELRELVRMVVRQGVFLSVLGILPGLAAAFALSRFIASRLYGVSPVELPLYGAAALLLILVGVLAALAPARAATRVDPVIALRSE